MNHQRIITDEIQKGAGNSFKYRLVRQKFRTQPMDFFCVGINITLRVDIEMQLIAGWHQIANFQRANFNDAMPLSGIKAGGFCI